MKSRRDLLRSGAGVVAVGGITSLAGCSNVPVVGSYFEDGADYTEWAYDPAELDKRSLWISYQDIGTILETDEVPDKGDLRDNVTSNYSGALMADDVEASISVDRAEILYGSFDGDTVVDEMKFSGAENYGDFDVYADSSEDKEEDALVATDGDYLVRVEPSAREYDAREELELLLDAYTGDADRYIDVSENFEQVDAELGSGEVKFVNADSEASVEEASDDTVVAMGIGAEIDGEETNGTYVLCYKSEDGVDLDEAETEIEEQLSDESELTDVSQDGRMVTGEFTVPTEDF